MFTQREYTSTRVADRGTRTSPCSKPCSSREQVHHIGGVGGVEEREARLQPERLGIAGDELVGDGMKSAPAQAPRPFAMPAQRGRPRQHVVRGAPCEGEQQDPLGGHAALEQSGHAGGQSAGLAGAGAGDDHKGIVAMDHCGQLGLVEIGVPGRIVVHMFDVIAPDGASTGKPPLRPCRATTVDRCDSAQDQVGP